MKHSHAILIGVGTLATAGLLWMHTKNKPNVGFGPSMRGSPMPAPPPYHPPPHRAAPRHMHSSKMPFPNPTLSTNNIYHRRNKAANIKGQADNDAWAIGFPTPKTGKELGPWTGNGACIGKEKRNNLQIWGSCDYC